MEKEGHSMGGEIRSIEQIRRERDPQFADFWESVEPRILAVTGGHWTIVNPIMHQLYNEKGIKDAAAVTDDMILQAHANWQEKQSPS